MIAKEEEDIGDEKIYLNQIRITIDQKEKHLASNMHLAKDAKDN